jgi:hypothetical protein
MFSSRLGLYALQGITNAVSYDPDAQAFINVTGISGTNALAINNLVLALKTGSLWTKNDAIYPIVGGTANTHKYNLKDPYDTDSAFRLTFSGSWTHSSTGMTADGITAYANTHLIPSGNLTFQQAHMSYYSRTSTGGNIKTYVTLGVNQGFAQVFQLYYQKSLGSEVIAASQNSSRFPANEARIVSPTDRLGHYINSRTGSGATDLAMYKNGILSANSTTLLATTINTIPIFIGAQNNNGVATGFDYIEYAFISIGDALTSGEAATYYTAIQNYQTALGRQV